MPSEATHTHKHLKPRKHRERETDRDIMKRHSNIASFDPQKLVLRKICLLSDNAHIGMVRDSAEIWYTHKKPFPKRH